MKKFTLFVVAAIVAAASFAQVPYKQNGEKVLRGATKSALRVKNAHRAQDASPQKLKAKAKAPAKAAAPTVITEQPAGELKTFARSGDATYAYWGYIFNTTQDGQAIQIVYGAGNKVYIQDLISQANTGTWVEGTLSSDGKTISIPTGQFIYYWDDYEYGLVLAKLKAETVEEDGETYDTYVEDESVTEITLAVGNDGVITLQNTDENAPVGLIYDDDLTWSGYADWNSVYSPVSYTGVEAPAGLATEDYSLIYDGGYTYEDGSTTSRNGHLVKVGKSGNDLYIQGLEADLPEAWVKGTIASDGKSVTFASNQYLGLGNNYFLFFKSGKYTVEYDDYYGDYDRVYAETEGLTLTIDGDKLIGGDKDVAIINGGDGEIYYYEVLSAPLLTKYADVAVTPEAPGIEYEDYFEDYGYNYLSLDISPVVGDSQLLDTEKLSYQVFIDLAGEVLPYTFYADEYDYLDADLDVVPYLFTDDYDFGEGGSYIYLYQGGFDKIGAQVIYTGGGEERRSDITWFDVATGETSVESGIKGISDAGKTAGTVNYTDIAGRKVSGSYRGIVIINGKKVIK